jgi:hypothetical protein
MTSTGSGVARSRMTSMLPFSSAASSNSLTAFTTKGRQASIDLGVK